MSLKFRNITTSPSDLVTEWGSEGISTAMERGELPDWHRIAVAVMDDPFGDVALDTQEAIALCEGNPVALSLGRILARAQTTQRVYKGKLRHGRIRLRAKASTRPSS